MAKRLRPRRPTRTNASRAVQRDRPYGNYNFLVIIDGVEVGGFSEVIIPGIVIDVIEFRNGNDPENAVRKIPGLARYPDVTLRRGIVGALDLYDWIDDVRNGDAGANRNVAIRLQNEFRTATVWTWLLRRAWPSQYSFGPLNAKGKDLAMEELVLTYEHLEIE